MGIELIGQILLGQSSLTPEQLKSALSLQQHRRPRPRIGQILLENHWISQPELARALAEQWKLPYQEKITAEQLNPQLLRRFPLDFLRKWSMLPITIPEPNTTAIALADPLDVETYDAILNTLGCYCPRIVCPTAEIEQAISSCYYKTMHLSDNDKTTPPSDNDSRNDTGNIITDIQSEDLLNIANQPPTIKKVNMIFFRAVQNRASDIHIEPYENDVKVRFRVDGVLHDILSFAKQESPALISRLKIMANLDIAERRLPQDGQSRIRIGQKEMDIRISTIPTSGGERVVLRLLDKGNQKTTLDQVGLSPAVENQFRELIHLTHGIILLTGPTGSGKTTTLYAALNELNCQERNILTVEDPIEYQLPGIGQMQVKPKINLSFANCLRHILRQDPDVIMVGEIRDRETADIAIQASLTGHLVLSTLHTNDSSTAITRLTDMGIEPYLISSSLVAVIAQRLLRRICPACKTACSPEQTRQTGIDQQLFYGTGCDKCLQTGYYGRIGIFELLNLDDDIKEMITNQETSQRIKEVALEKGMITLRSSGIEKAHAGETTMEEVIRVTQNNYLTEIDMVESVAS